MADAAMDILILRPSRGKWLLVLLGSLAFVAIGVLISRDKSPPGGVIVPLLCIGFFGLCALVAFLQLLPGASYLRLAPEGLTVCATWRIKYYRWDDISEFGATTIPAGLTRKKIIGFNFSMASTHPQRYAKVNRFNVSVCGYESGLPDNYGLDYQALADLLNERLSQARARAMTT